MRKLNKIAIVLFAVCLIFITTLSLGCAHQHVYSSEWTFNENYHWKTATCEHSDVIGMKSTHKYDENYKCTECKYQHEHTYDLSQWYSSDAYHWRKAICHDEISPKEVHTLQDGKCKYCKKQLIEETYVFNEDQTGYIFAGYYGSATDYTVPATHENKSVVGIAKNAFINSSIQTLTIPDSVIEIEKGALNGLGSLQKLTIPFVGTTAFATQSDATTLFGAIFGEDAFDGATQIRQSWVAGDEYFYVPRSLTEVTVLGGKVRMGGFENCKYLTKVTLPTDTQVVNDGIAPYLFSGCTSLSEVTLPTNTTYIDRFAFTGCTSLAQIEMPSIVKYIGDYAFENTAIEQVNLPRYLELLGVNAFTNCAKISSFTISEENSHFSTQSGVLYDDAKSKILLFPTAYVGEYDLPSTVKLPALYAEARLVFSKSKNLTAINVADHADYVSENGILYNKEKTAIVAVPKGISGQIQLPDTLTYVGANMFIDCVNVTAVTATAIKSIGQSAFAGCTSLKNFTTPSTLTRIDSNAFAGCSQLEWIIIDDSVATIGAYAFSSCPNVKIYCEISQQPTETVICPEHGNISMDSVENDKCGVCIQEGKDNTVTYAGWDDYWSLYSGSAHNGENVFMAGEWEIINGVPTEIQAE